jgi:hypothetical protein
VKLVKDINGHPNIIGDGINVAQRIMSFARPGQIVVSRSYYDVVSNLASEYAKLFTYEGSRTDKHVREHEIYVVGHHEGALQKAKDGMKDRASSTTPNPPRRGGSPSNLGTATVTLTIPSFVNDKKKLTMVAAALGVVVVILGVLVVTKKPSAPDNVAASDLARAAAPKPEAPKVVEAAAAPTVVPAPTPSVPAPIATAPTPVAASSPTPASATQPAPPPASDAKGAPAKPAEPTKAEAAKAEAAKAEATKVAAGIVPATLLFSVQPWGEIFVNGKSQGVTPPKKLIKLDPGKYKIEIRNTTFPPHVENVDLKARDELTVRHRFQ